MVREQGTAMRCKQCGYDLHGLSERRCPECGRRFEPKNSGTYLTKPISGRRYLSLALMCVVLVGAPLLIAALQDLDVLHVHGLVWLVLLVPIWIPIGIVIGCYVLRTSCAAYFDRLPWTKHRFAFVSAFVISSLIVIGGFGVFAFQVIRRITS